MEVDARKALKSMRWKLFLLGVFKIPVIGFVRPKLLFLNHESVEVGIGLRRRTKNHLNSMYFGVLAVGADIAAAIQAFYFVEQSGNKVSLAFKSMKADFLKRAETNVIFKSNEGGKIRAAIELSKSTGERINELICVEAYDQEGEKVADFVMELSVRVSKKR